jgi:hypothetical protein
MYTEKDGAILIEVNPRAGGGPSREFHLAVREQDPMINFFLSHMNIPINPPRVDAKIAAIGCVSDAARRLVVLFASCGCAHAGNTESRLQSCSLECFCFILLF